MKYASAYFPHTPKCLIQNIMFVLLKILHDLVQISNDFNLCVKSSSRPGITKSDVTAINTAHYIVFYFTILYITETAYLFKS